MLEASKAVLKNVAPDIPEMQVGFQGSFEEEGFESMDM